MQLIQAQMEELKTILLKQPQTTAKNGTVASDPQFKSLKTNINTNLKLEVQAGVEAIKSELRKLATEQTKDPETRGNTDWNGQSSKKQIEYDAKKKGTEEFLAVLQANFEKERASMDKANLRAMTIAKQQSAERLATLNILTAASCRSQRLRTDERTDDSKVFTKLNAALRVWRVQALQSPPTSFKSAADGVKAEIVNKLGDAHDPSFLESVIQDSLGPEYEKCFTCLDSKFDTVDFGNVDFSKCTELLDANLQEACISQNLSFIGTTSKLT